MIVVIATTSMAFAQAPERAKREMRPSGEMMKRHKQFAERMDNFFTEEQQEQIKALRIESAKKVKPLRNELRELEARQQTLTTAEKADIKAIYKNIDEMSEVKTEIQKIMAKQQQDIRSMLTDEQLLKYDAMKDRMHERRNDSFRDRSFRGDRKG